jgi:predicted DNA-binding protein (UPF0251 family)
MNSTDTKPTDVDPVAARAERNERIRFLHSVGQSERQIARHVGISRSAVWSVLQASKPR